MKNIKNYTGHTINIIDEDSVTFDKKKRRFISDNPTIIETFESDEVLKCDYTDTIKSINGIPCKTQQLIHIDKIEKDCDIAIVVNKYAYATSDKRAVTAINPVFNDGMKLVGFLGIGQVLNKKPTTKLSTNKPYKYYYDDGHGWLAVKFAELVSLDLVDKISSYSYKSATGKTVYLEHDLDMQIFADAKKDAGETVTTVDKEAPHIRYLQAFKEREIPPETTPEAVKPPMTESTPAPKSETPPEAQEEVIEEDAVEDNDEVHVIVNGDTVVVPAPEVGDMYTEANWQGVASNVGSGIADVTDADGDVYPIEVERLKRIDD